MEKIVVGREAIEISSELPLGIERRLVLRLLSYWRSICQGGQFPSMAAIDLSDLPDIHPHSFAIDLALSVPVFMAVGTHLASHSEKPLIGMALSDVGKNLLPSVAVSYIDEMLQKCAPVSRGGTLNNADETRLLYRSVLLPISDDGVTVNGILGAANCRAIPPNEIVDYLQDSD